MSDETIKISILVAVYNVENYIERCIESIIGQSYRNLEIMLIDDGSTDRCPEICDDYAKRDERIRVIHRHNGGLVSVRKMGAAAVTGDYVLSVDGDDWIEKDRIEVLVRDGILPTHADMICLAGHILDFEEKESIYQCINAPIRLFENDEIETGIFPLMLKQDIIWSLWSWAIRKELLLKNQILVDDRVTNGDDFLCVCFCLLEAKSAMTIQQGGYHYTMRTSSLSHQITTPSDENFLRMKIWYQVLKDQLEQRHASEKVQEVCNQIAIDHVMGLDYSLFLRRFPDYLFPFSNVNSGARIVVYGAGRFGYRFVQSLSKAEKYSIVLWVDQDQTRPAVPGYTISSREAIPSVDYDFIVVAIKDAAVSKEIKHSLILDGIPEEKIETMDIRTIL